MTLTGERLEEKVTDELAGVAHFVTMARPLVDGMLALLKEQRAEIAMLETEVNRLENELSEGEADRVANQLLADRMRDEVAALKVENRRLRTEMQAEREEVATLRERNDRMLLRLVVIDNWKDWVPPLAPGEFDDL